MDQLYSDGFKHRFLEDGEEEPPPAKWEPILTTIILVVMFAVLITDRVGTDSVMLTALTVFYVSGIIDVKEALSGFSSQGLLTVLVLFVVAEGLNKTGALNWYVGKLFGNPTTLAGAQLRVMIPITLLSGVINDSPLVTVTLPIVIQWARRVNLSNRFILMPLSFAALLGGVMTIIGTSTNLIVVGLLIDRYPDDLQFQKLPLFGIGKYGFPVAVTGVAYVVLMSPLLLGRKKYSTVIKKDEAEDVLLGARLTQWSPAAGRTIKRSGLRDTGGIYLVRVKRQATGNVHTAVGPEFVLQVGDILYFTGLVETFGAFCEEHGLELITNEVEITEIVEMQDDHVPLLQTVTEDTSVDSPMHSPTKGLSKPQVDDISIGMTLDSLLAATSQERMRLVYKIEDAIRGASMDYTVLVYGDVSRVVVAKENDLVIVAIDSQDRSGLLLDISKCLARMEFELHHTEAKVINGRSLSIWRCESTKKSDTEEYLSEVWSIVKAVLARDSGVLAVKQRGLQVLRAQVRGGSRLIGKAAMEVNFRDTFKAAIVAIRKVDGKTHAESLSTVTFDEGDVLVLQVTHDSNLLLSPPDDFYTKKQSGGGRSSFLFLSSAFTKGSTEQSDSIESSERDPEALDRSTNTELTKQKEAIWNDLQVLKAESSVGELEREFLTAMKVQDSRLGGKTVAQAGIDKLPGVYLVSIERPTVVAGSVPQVESFAAIPLSDPLERGDVLWFTGAASSVGDLRKIPGLVLYENDELSKLNERVHTRRLVEAVVSRQGPLVGKTPKEVRFRTQYGAAVIAVHREGKRVHELPGNITLQAGDVLLLEAGQSFMDKKDRLDKAFTLIAEVDDSAPPRFRMLIPAVFLTLAAYVCYMLKLSSLFGTAMVAAILMVMLGVLSEEEARDAIRWEIYLTIAPAFGVGQALINSGVAGAVAAFLVKIGNAIGLGNAGLLGAVYLATVLISQMVANNAAAALIFPIAMDAAETAGMDLTMMAYNIMFAASAAFMTPFGYQTNLMVMGPGGYSTSDYLIFGTPMQVVLLFATTTFMVVPLWWVSWLASLAVLGVVSVLRVSQDIRNTKRKNSSSSALGWLSGLRHSSTTAESKSSLGKVSNPPNSPAGLPVSEILSC